MRTRQREFARAQFIEVGLDLFHERGYAQTTIEELAARCGCAKGTVYAHFPGGKDELFRDIYTTIGAEFDERFRTKLASSGDDVVGYIEAAAAVLMEISAQPGKGRFFMIEAPALPHVLGSALGRTGRGIIKGLSERIESAQRKGNADPDLVPQHVSYIVLSMLRELGIRVAEGVATPEELMAALDGILRGTLLHGVKPKPKRAA
jgi:AcrR family transcriptional regulator